MLPLILAGLAGATISAMLMVKDEEMKKPEEIDTNDVLEKAKQALNLSQEAIKHRDMQIEELEQLIAELTAKQVMNHAEVMESVNT